ncbi:penicillin-binding protein [Cellulomonas sp. DKR-3]|uniref:Penicillin-binding protein n=1 Tax=Cellulomonas fulva TaxID=2835530 RepID=A0ABS5TXV1_9CELL|nr:penicillin-binding protein [Cellulomonas fulva]MBT0993937.1 penicillin-binding protein [Cellulomonas fulva]
MPQPARARGRQVNVFQALALLLSFVLVAAVGGVLAAGLVLPGVAVANGVTDMSITAFDDLPTELEQKPLPEKSSILASDGTLLATFYDQDRVVVPGDKIAQVMKDAVIATEDKRFYEHSGIDLMGMVRAAARNALNTSREGASTLTQQYVKNVLIEAARQADTPEERAEGIEQARTAEGAEGLARKLREAKLAITLEKTMSKDEILAKYLNIAQFGTSVYGVESAAQRYFGVSAADLNYLQAATIAGITQAPSRWDPLKDPKQSQTRRNTVLRLMHEQGYITDAEYKKGRAAKIKNSLHPKETQLGCMSADENVAGSGFFCDYVTKIIAKDETFGKTSQERSERLLEGGLTIWTTLDKDMQEAADKEVKAGVPVKDSSGVGSSIVVVEPGTGQVKAMAQNRIYNNTQEVGSRETAVNFNTDNAYGSASGFPPGSTFKPFTLLEWLREGHSLNETVDGTRMEYQQSEFNAPCTNLVGDYKFGNSEGSGGYMSVLKATENSVNSAYIAMASKLDLCKIMDGSADLGVHLAGGAAGEGTMPYRPSNVIGSDSIAPLTMAAAYAGFAANGVYCSPVAIVKVTDANGKKLKVPNADCHQGIEAKYAHAINFALSHVWEGTASNVPKPSFAAAGKTGTTTYNEHTWFIGYTPKLATAVWVGYPDGLKSMHEQTINGNTYWSGPYGSSIAAPTWARFMNDALEGGDNPDFTEADTDEIYGKQISVPYVVGLSESDARSRLYAAGFQVSVSSERVESDVAEGLVAEQSPSGSAVKGSVISLRLSSGPAPEPPDPCQEGKGPGCDNGNGNGNGNGDGNRGPGGDDGFWNGSVLDDSSSDVFRSTNGW